MAESSRSAAYSMDHPRRACGGALQLNDDVPLGRDLNGWDFNDADRTFVGRVGHQLLEYHGQSSDRSVLLGQSRADLLLESGPPLAAEGHEPFPGRTY